jgi:AcrR family transcriptional regulator
MSLVPRPLRADAERNRRLLLDAAAEAFAEGGFDVSVAEIARRAGVGQGTVFRRFPTKDDLVAAVVADRLTEFALAAEAAAEKEPWAALAGFVEEFLVRHLHDRALFESLEARAMSHDAVRDAQLRVLAAVETLVVRARDAGVVRDDLEAVDVPLLVLGVAHVAAPFVAVAPDTWRRYLAFMLDGLRPGAPPLPVRALSFAEIDRACGRTGTRR